MLTRRLPSAARCSLNASGTRSQNSRSVEPFMHVAFGFASIERWCRVHGARSTSPSAQRAPRSTCVGASGTDARSTAPDRRQMPSFGRAKSSAIELGMRIPPGGSLTPDGSWSWCGSTRTRWKPPNGLRGDSGGTTTNLRNSRRDPRPLQPALARDQHDLLRKQSEAAFTRPRPSSNIDMPSDIQRVVFLSWGGCRPRCKSPPTARRKQTPRRSRLPQAIDPPCVKGNTSRGRDSRQRSRRPCQPRQVQSPLRIR